MAPVSIACLIYRSPRYADATWNSIREFTPEIGHSVRFFFVANDATRELLDHLRSKGYPFVEHYNTEHKLDGYAPPYYMRGVYMGWNRAFRESDEIAVLTSSDFMYSPDWLQGMLNELTDKTIVTSKIVERRHPVHGVNGRAWEKDFGTHPDTFKKHDFLDFVQTNRRRDTESGGTFGPIAVHKSNAAKVGFYPEGNPVGTYGDREFFDRLDRIGVKHVTSLNSIVYHFKEGEMRE